MVGKALRVAIGLSGMLMIVVFLRDWMDPVAVGAKLGFGPTAPLGFASLRADIGGFFGGAGIFALAAAVRDNRELLAAPLLLMVLALLGRCVALVFIPFDMVLLPPMVVEAGLAGLYLAGRRNFG
jgi:hypothetical protein